MHRILQALVKACFKPAASDSGRWHGSWRTSPCAKSGDDVVDEDVHGRVKPGKVKELLNQPRETASEVKRGAGRPRKTA